jgi:hypothetical protein
MCSIDFKNLVARRWEKKFNNIQDRDNFESQINIKLIFFQVNKYNFTSYDYDILFIDKLDNLFNELCEKHNAIKKTKKDSIEPIELIKKIMFFSDRYHIEIKNKKIIPIIIYNHHKYKHWK